MIKISSFHPFQGFMRITQEFHEEKAVVKIKSLTFERDIEFEYKDVGEISDGFLINSGQMSFGFWTFVVVSAAAVYFRCFLDAHPVLLQIARMVFILTLLLFLSSFKKTWRIYISDEKGNLLAHIDQTKRNRTFIPQVVELIKSKSPDLVELSAADPFPKEQPKFEHTYVSFSRLSKTIDRFYDNEMIGHEKGIYSEHIYRIAYDRLSDRVNRERSSDGLSGEILSLALFLVPVMYGLTFLFSVELGKTINTVMLILLALLILSLSSNLIKRETVGIYDKDGRVYYWTYINQRNKAHVEEILAFVFSRIPAEAKN